MNFWIIISSILLFTSTEKPRVWEYSRNHICNDSIVIHTRIYQKSNPATSSPSKYEIEFDAEVEISLNDIAGDTSAFVGRSGLIYQCALCAPAKIKGGNRILRFQLANLFKKKSLVNGVFYGTLSNFKYKEKPLYEPMDSCWKDLHMKFEMID